MYIVKGSGFIEKYIYALTDGQNIKIGITINIKRRIKQLQTGNSNKLYLLGYFVGDRKEEFYIHTHFQRITLEWMKATNELLEYLNLRIKDSEIMWIDNKLRSLFKMKL